MFQNATMSPHVIKMCFNYLKPIRQIILIQIKLPHYKKLFLRTRPVTINSPFSTGFMYWKSIKTIALHLKLSRNQILH